MIILPMLEFFICSSYANFVFWIAFAFSLIYILIRRYI